MRRGTSADAVKRAAVTRTEILKYMKRCVVAIGSKVWSFPRKTPSEVAKAIKRVPGAVAVAMKAMATRGYLDFNGDGTYSLTILGETLTRRR